MKKVINVVVIVFAVLFFRAVADIHAQEPPYYQGQSIKIIVGFTSGGFYDRWSRLLARYVPKYIPGNPEMIVQNMPGAGGLVAANHVYSVAKPDGLTLGMLSYGIYLDQLVGRKEVQYDVRKFNWIGSPEKSDVLFYMRSDVPISRWKIFAQRARRPSAGPPARREPIIFSPACWKTPSGSRLIPCWVIRAGARLTWRWKRARCNVAA
jgi:tripartite-type tricarboxylate transporter receptor subunit TctC